jgi:hypothetical protein
MKKRKHKLFIVFYSIWIVLFLLLINSANKRYDECIDALFAKNACDELFGKSIDDLKILLISPLIIYLIYIFISNFLLYYKNLYRKD